MSMRFRNKLMLSYVLFIILIVGTFFFFFKNVFQSNLIQESSANLVSQTSLAKLLVEQDKRLTPPQQLAERIGSAIKARVTLIGTDGTVLGDSDVGKSRVPDLENHLNRPEIQAALKNGIGSAVRYSDTLRRDLMYVALKSDIGFVRLALPLDAVASTTAMLHGILGGVALLTILAALALSYSFSNMTSRPIREIADAAARIGRGQQHVSIPVSSHDEIGDLAHVLNEMSGRIASHLKNLSTERQRLDTILRGMGEGVMVASGDGTISLVNPAFRALFSITGEVEGRRLIEVSRNPDLLAAFEELRASEGELIREIHIPTKDVTLLTHWVPLLVDGMDHGVVAVFHDITDMKRVENMRRDFVANVSHELRTPVSVIKGYAETLLDGVIESDPARSKRFVEIMQQHSERLAALINDILTLSQLESKETSLDLYPLDISGTIARACVLIQEGAIQKNIEIRNQSSVGLPRVMADQGRLEQILVNLLENAVKYTPEGGRVTIFTENDREFLKVSVTDNGIGIPAKDLPRIFERFYRVDEARSREEGGTGLGLSIVKHIVQLHGGEITVSSDPGRGSIFSFTLRKVPNVTT